MHEQGVVASSAVFVEMRVLLFRVQRRRRWILVAFRGRRQMRRRSRWGRGIEDKARGAASGIKGRRRRPKFGHLLLLLLLRSWCWRFSRPPGG